MFALSVEYRWTNLLYQSYLETAVRCPKHLYDSLLFRELFTNGSSSDIHLASC
jgi:hypothetical protein